MPPKPNNDNDNALLLRALPAFAGIGVGRTQAYKMLNAGTPPAVKVGTSTFVRRTDWEAFLANLPSYRANSAGAAKPEAA